jgi:hypothetical protein
VKLHCSGTPPKATRWRTGTKVRANSATGSGDLFCPSLQNGQKILAGDTTVSHAAVRHSDTERAKQLATIDPDWNCLWPLEWQRHYRILADLVEADGSLPDIAPGVLMDDDDIGRWLPGRNSRPPGRSYRPNSRSGCHGWASSRSWRRLPPLQPSVPPRARARRSRLSNAA